MRPVTDYPHDPNKPWLVIGKGPTALSCDFEEYWGSPSRGSTHNIICLNQAIEMGTIRGAGMHFIDYEVWLSIMSDTFCEYAETAHSIIAPIFPHWRQKPDYTRSISDFLQFDKQLKRRSDEGELFVYNALLPSHSYHPVWDIFPTYPVHGFSIEAVIQIIADLGGKQIYTAGIDGGAERHENWEDCYREHEVSYDAQQPHIDRICKERGLQLIPIGR